MTEEVLIDRVARLSADQLRASRAALRELTGDWRTLRVPVAASAHVPVSAGQWCAVLEDAGLDQRWARVAERLARIVDLCRQHTRQIGRGLPHRVSRLICEVGAFRRDAAQVLWFRPPAHAKADAEAVRQLTDAASGAVVEFLEILTAEPFAPAGAEKLGIAIRAADSAAARVAAAATRTDPNDEDSGLDVVASAYGVPQDEVRRGRGIATSGRIAALWKGSPEELEDLARQLFAHLLLDECDYIPDPTSHLAALIGCARPLPAHRAAIWTRDLVLCSFAERRDASIAAIVATMERAGEVWSTHLAIVAASHAIDEAADHDDDVRMRETANLYRTVIEGPVRRTGIALLRMLGDDVEGRVMIAKVAERLASHRDSELCALLASVIEPAWRNPAAHEELQWDPIARTAVMSGRPVDLATIHRSALVGYAAHQGFEAA